MPNKIYSKSRTEGVVNSTLWLVQLFYIFHMCLPCVLLLCHVSSHVIEIDTFTTFTVRSSAWSQLLAAGGGGVGGVSYGFKVMVFMLRDHVPLCWKTGQSSSPPP